MKTKIQTIAIVFALLMVQQFIALGQTQGESSKAAPQKVDNATIVPIEKSAVNVNNQTKSGEATATPCCKGQQHQKECCKDGKKAEGCCKDGKKAEGCKGHQHGDKNHEGCQGKKAEGKTHDCQHHQHGEKKSEGCQGHNKSATGATKSSKGCCHR